MTACDIKSINEGAAMRLFSNFIWVPDKAPFSHRVIAENNNSHQQEGKLTTYGKVVNYLLETYTIDDVIAKDEAEITSFKQPAGRTAVRFSEVLCEKELRCGRVYDESRLIRIFTEGLHSCIRYCLRAY